MPRPANNSSLSIGKVLRALSTEFPDISISKIRYLESEGLITPARSRSGYRMYAASDVERLRYVLRAQRDRYWPLRVIRESLDALERGLVSPDGELTPTPPPVPEVEGIPAIDPDPSGVEGGVRLTSTELAQSASICDEQVATLQEYGIIKPDPDGYFTVHDQQAARAAGELAAYGVEPRHLRSFRVAADREITLVEQAVGARRGATAKDSAQVARSCVELHVALVRAGLRR